MKEKLSMNILYWQGIIYNRAFSDYMFSKTKQDIISGKIIHSMNLHKNIDWKTYTSANILWVTLK